MTRSSLAILRTGCVPLSTSQQKRAGADCSIWWRSFTYGESMKKTFAAAILAAMGLGLAAPAQASEQTYLAALADYYGAGYINDPQFALQAGYTICRGIENGGSDDQLVEHVVANTKLGRVDAGFFVAIAREQLCPARG